MSTPSSLSSGEAAVVRGKLLRAVIRGWEELAKSLKVNENQNELME